MTHREVIELDDGSVRAAELIEAYWRARHEYGHDLLRDQDMPEHVRRRICNLTQEASVMHGHWSLEVTSRTIRERENRHAEGQQVG